MEDPSPNKKNNNTESENSSNTKEEKKNNNNSTNSERVRSRWTPKPEQILILESIFNSGMVNPPKEETIRIRKLLEKFGAVGDANVFYWFQNRRSRSRRRQRQLQASLAATAASPPLVPPPLLGGSGGCGGGSGVNLLYELSQNQQQNSSVTTTIGGCSSSVGCFAPCSSVTSISNTNSFGDCGGVDDVFGTFSGIINTTHQLDCHSQGSNLDFQSGLITVFINGVATQVPEGVLDMRSMFGEEVILVHSSGAPVPFNDFGISLQSLQHGESYFLTFLEPKDSLTALSSMGPKTLLKNGNLPTSLGMSVLHKTKI